MREPIGEGAGRVPAVPTTVGSFALGATTERDGETLAVVATGLDGTPFAGRSALAVLTPLGDDGGGPPVAGEAIAPLKELDHPNLARVVEVGLAEGWAGVVQDPPPGPTLAARVAREGPLPAPWVVDLVGAVAGGLAALHARGLSHGRVRPETVGVPDGRPVVVGGLAPFARGGPVSRDRSPYLAPEATATGPSPAADQYALAATAAFALTGRPPASGANGLGVPAALTAVIERAMAPDPEARFPDVAAFAPAFGGAVAAAAEATVGGAWEAVERRDFGMASVLIEAARRLAPDHAELPALAARMTAEGHGLDLPDERASAATGLPPGFEFLTASPAPLGGKRTGSNPWILFAVVGFLGVIALVVLAVLVLAFQG